MRRLASFGWAFLVSVWAGILGSAGISLPSLDYVQLYTIGFQLVTLPLAYWTIRANDAALDDAHKPGRVGMFIVGMFVVAVPLSSLFGLLFGTTGAAGAGMQLLAFAAALSVSLYVAYGGGFERAWDRYT